MSRYHSHINTSIKLIEAYKGDAPFNQFIKQFFATEKKFGSKDRKQISSLCFSWFRLGLAFDKQLQEENLLAAFFLCHTGTEEIIRSLKPEWYEKLNDSLEDKLLFLKGRIRPDNFFPFKDELSHNINFEAFCKSFSVQPDLFVRIRPQHKISTVKKIKSAGLPYHFLNDDNCARFPSGTKIDTILETDSEVVIQDYNSQMVLNYLQENLPGYSAKKEAGALSVWDCCAASGGKSILLTDIIREKINLTVSDIRPGSITNLHQRFKKAGIKEYQYFITDTSNPDDKVFLVTYDIIICDAPCTGSGTWSRTPEQLYFFQQPSIDSFAEKQKRIVNNAVLHLKEGGVFFYITCSVFEKENELLATYIQQKLQLELLQMTHLHGYDKKADSMFVAVFKKTG